MSVSDRAETVGYLRVLRDVCGWNDDPKLDELIRKLNKDSVTKGK